MRSVTTEQRTQHPYHLYEAIVAQPDAFARVACASSVSVDQVAQRMASCDRLFVVGIGTSHHAAQAGEHLIRSYGGGLPVHSVHAFDFALYGPPLTPRDGVVAISHRGNKGYSIDSLKRAREAGCTTVLITGEGHAAGSVFADVTFPTVEQEKSSAHSISYVGAIAMLAVLAERLGHHRTGASPLPRNLLDDVVPQAMRKALTTEESVAKLAREHLRRRRFCLVGGGPGAITAQEIALKIKETCFLLAEGVNVESLLHGPFQASEKEDLFILIAPVGAAQSRMVELAGMVSEIGAAYLVVSDGTPRSIEQGADGWCVVPAVPEPFTTLTCLLPLQLFAYHLALGHGTNPDGFRLDDPRFARAHKLIQL